MHTIRLKDDYIKLGQALKAAGVVESGVDAKFAVQDGLVKVNGQTETQRGKKLVDYRSVCTAGPSSFYNTGAYCRRIRHSCRSSRRFPPLFRSAECGNRLRGNESV